MAFLDYRIPDLVAARRCGSRRAGLLFRFINAAWGTLPCAASSPLASWGFQGKGGTST